MADHAAAVRTRLLAHSGTSALVSTRVWHSVLPQEPASGTYMPAIVVQNAPGESEYAMGGPVGIASLRVQVDVWDDDRAGCEALRAQVQDALQAFAGTAGSVTLTTVGLNVIETPSWQPESKLWRAITDYELWATE